jgi:hypothetical protein
MFASTVLMLVAMVALFRFNDGMMIVLAGRDAAA